MGRVTTLTIAIVASLAIAGISGAAEPTIDSVAWLAGCWVSDSPSRVIEEQWTAPRGGTMLGVGRTVRGGRTIDHEFVLLSIENGALVYFAHPAGQTPAKFRAAAASADRVVFDNPEHDYPQQVGYERRGNALVAWIDGKQDGVQRRVDFQYRRVTCDR